MDGLTLIRAARALGLTVIQDGDRLVVRGPASLEPIAQALLDSEAKVMAALADAALLGIAAEWPAAARKHFLDKYAVTKDKASFDLNGPAWRAAVLEANRIAAGVPIRRGDVPEPKCIDHALAAFAPLGGLTFVEVVKRDQLDLPLPEPRAKQSSPPPSNPD